MITTLLRGYNKNMGRIAACPQIIHSRLQSRLDVIYAADRLYFENAKTAGLHPFSSMFDPIRVCMISRLIN
jgi:hypothetical protein